MLNVKITIMIQIEEMHKQSLEWKKLLQFYKNEILFFQNYLDEYIKSITDRDKSDILHVFKSKFVEIGKEISDLNDIISTESTLVLKNLDINNYDEVKKILARHEHLQPKMRELERSCKGIKEDVYDFFVETSSI